MEQQRWWFWMLWRRPYPTAPYEYTGVGPYRMTPQEAFNAEFRLRSQYLTPYIYRWLWDPRRGWYHDDRSDRVLVASL